jgi:hypothetical protein
MGVTALPPGVRISLREFLLLFIAFAIGFTALKFANQWWLAAIGGVTLLTFLAASIVAIIDRGPRQAYAIGFAACVIGYAPLFMLGNEMDPFTGELPTSRMLQPVFLAVRVQTYLNVRTREELLESQLPDDALIEGKSAFPNYRPPNSVGTYFVRSSSLPDLQHFMPIGHCLWVLLLGYAGGHFARWVYFRRLREQNVTSQVAAG